MPALDLGYSACCSVPAHWAGCSGMTSGVFIALAATTFVAALLYAISGFVFAVLGHHSFLLSLDPTPAIQFVIIVLTALSIGVVRGLLRENRAVACVIGTDVATFERVHSRLHREERDRCLIREDVRHDTENYVASPSG